MLSSATAGPAEAPAGAAAGVSRSAPSKRNSDALAAPVDRHRPCTAARPHPPNRDDDDVIVRQDEAVAATPSASSRPPPASLRPSAPPRTLPPPHPLLHQQQTTPVPAMAMAPSSSSSAATSSSSSLQVAAAPRLVPASAASNTNAAPTPSSATASISSTPPTPFPDPLAAAAALDGSLSALATATAAGPKSPTLPSPTMSPTLNEAMGPPGSTPRLLYPPSIPLANNHQIITAASAASALRLSIVDQPIPSLDIHNIVQAFDHLSPDMKNQLLAQLIKRCSFSNLQFISSLVLPSLRSNFVSIFPVELTYQILSYLDIRTISRFQRVCKSWHRILESEGAELAVWKRRLVDENFLDDDEINSVQTKFLAAQARRLHATTSAAAVTTATAAASAPSDLAPMDTDPITELGLTSSASSLTDLPSSTSSSSSSFAEQPLLHPSVRRPFQPTPPSSLHGPSSTLAHPNQIQLSSASSHLGSAALRRSGSSSAIGSGVVFTGLYKNLYKRHHLIRRNWFLGRYRHISFPGQGPHVVTCLQFDTDKIVSASDDQTIRIYNPADGSLRRTLEGHEGGVWALQYWENTLVSGSTDRSVRVWDMDSGKCSHIFDGHTSTVRCLILIVPDNKSKPSNFNGGSGNSSSSSIRSSAHSSSANLDQLDFPVIVTGSRDTTIRVWRLPDPRRDPPWSPAIAAQMAQQRQDQNGAANNGHDSENQWPNGANPYFMHVLMGHSNSVRAIAGHGTMLISGSYDCTVRAWNIATGECLHVFRGHREKVYTVGYCHELQRAVSGSMDSTVKVWCTRTGVALFNLEGHSSLVGLLELSPQYLISAAADATLRIWSPVTGQCLASLTGHAAAITCFHHDPRYNRVVSGSDGGIKVWELSSNGYGTNTNILNASANSIIPAESSLASQLAYTQGSKGPAPIYGRFICDVVNQVQGVWRVRMDEKRLVCAVQREEGGTWFEVLDFSEPEEPDALGLGLGLGVGLDAGDGDAGGDDRMDHDGDVGSSVSNQHPHQRQKGLLQGQGALQFDSRQSSLGNAAGFAHDQAYLGSFGRVDDATSAQQQQQQQDVLQQPIQSHGGHGSSLNNHHGSVDAHHHNPPPRPSSYPDQQ